MEERAPTTTPHSPSSRIRILTLNLFLRPPLIHSHDSDHKASRSARFISTVLPHYDIIALQECFAFGTSRRDALIRDARKAGFEHHYACPKGSLFRAQIDGGLLILSRLEIVQTGSVVFGRGVHSDWLAAKGVIYAKIALTPTSHLHLFTTHLQASYGGGPHPFTAPSVQIRAAQLEIAKTFIDETLATHLPSSSHATDRVLFVGDFNVNGRPVTANEVQHGDEYKRMMDILGKGCTVRDLLYGASGDGMHPVTTGTLFAGTVEPSQSSIDYMFEIVPGGAGAADGGGGGGLRFEEVKREEFKMDPAEGLPYTHISDHLGVSCVLVTEPPASH
ncbi:hypothetical protein PhCBS80983_g03769 [Powellomyces hirtus]|uniref:sphingomyelin phosphodiesterase n=1 Tax=Powellomyces hirtus TaxID=109895 RepID=A0A507E2J4_9FUNG|nr:hypothetical protein PhCBS80983_g03769 [Powellomyces hirtus]